MPTSLRVVTSAAARDSRAKPAPAATLGQQVHQLQTEAKRLAAEHVALLAETLRNAQAVAEEISLGGDAYPAGVRDLARRISEDSASKVQTLEAILARTEQPRA